MTSAGRDGRHHADAGGADRASGRRRDRSTAIASTARPPSARRAKHLETRRFSLSRSSRHEGAVRAGEGVMRQWGSCWVWRLAASLALGACVQTRQYADVQFTRPQGDYKLLVLRPDVTVGSLTTGGMVEPRADWTEQARANIIAALRAQQAARGGKVTIIEHRNELARRHRAGARRRRAAELRRRRVDRRAQISRRLSADQARQGPRLDARAGRGEARAEDRLRLCAVPPCRGRGRVDAAGSRSACSGLAGCIVGFCAPNVGGAEQLDYASLVDLKTGEVVWFNVVDAGEPGAGDQVRRPADARRARRRWSSGCSAG